MTTDLERDVLFQVNAIVWATFPLAADPDGTYHPALKALGFSLLYLEMPLRPTAGDITRMQAAQLQVTQIPVADIVLRTGDNPPRFVIVEAKASSFGAVGDGRTVRQARGLVFAAGNAASRVGSIGAPSGIACHLVPEGQAPLMAESADAIAAQLENDGLLPIGEVSTLGLSVRNDGVWLSSHPVKRADGSHRSEALFPEPLLILAPDADPRPLYIVPWHPDSKDQTGERIFAQKTKTRFVGRVQDVPLGQAFIDYHQILSDMSSGIYDAWRDQESFGGKLVATVRSVLRNLADGVAEIDVQSAGVMVRIDSEATRDRVIEALAGVRVGPSQVEGFQPPLRFSRREH